MPESVPLTGSRGPATQLRRPEPSLVPLAPAVPSSWATAKPHAETFCAQLLVTLSCAGGGRNRLRCLCCHHLLPEHSTWPWPRGSAMGGHPDLECAASHTWLPPHTAVSMYVRRGAAWPRSTETLSAGLFCSLDIPAQSHFPWRKTAR